MAHGLLYASSQGHIKEINHMTAVFHLLLGSSCVDLHTATLQWLQDNASGLNAELVKSTQVCGGFRLLNTFSMYNFLVCRLL